MSCKHDKMRNILLMCFGIVVALLLSEIASRLYYHRQYSDKTLDLSDGPSVYAHKPSIKFTNEYGVEVEYNSLGFIGKEIQPKTEHGFRILAIGDSITEAVFLTDEERYVNRLAVILSEKTGRPVEAINAGIGGYNTWQELELLQAKGLSVKPDLILVGVCLNDFFGKKPALRKGLFGRIVENYRDGSRARRFNFIYQRSDLYKLVYDFLATRRRGGLDGEGYIHYLEDYEYLIKQEDFEKWKDPFSKMLSLAENNNAKIIFAIFPLENQVIKGKDNSYSPLSDFFKENNAYYIDLIDYFKDHLAEGQPLYKKRDIIHPSGLGHRIAAEAIADYIFKNGLIDYRIKEE